MDGTTIALEELADRVNKELLDITNKDWKGYARPAMLSGNEKKERAAAVRMAHRETKNQFVKILRAQKLEALI